MLILICGGYIIDAVITAEDSRCQYEESIICCAVQTFIVASFYGMAALRLASFMACNKAMVVFGQYQMREEFQHILRREVTPLNNTRATYNRYDISSQVCMVVLSFVMCCYYRTYIGACVS